MVIDKKEEKRLKNVALREREAIAARNPEPIGYTLAMRAIRPLTRGIV